MAENWQKKVLALTGSIGSGKSTALNIFSDLGAFTLSADELAKKLTEKGTLGLKKVVDTFGEEYLNQDSELNREKLAKVIFNDKSKRKTLESILHPLIQKKAEEIFEEAFKNDYPLYVYEIPLLFETGQENDFKLSVMIYAPENICLERIVKRNGLSLDEAKQRLASQMSIEDKAKLADIVIENNLSKDELKKKIELAWDKISLSSSSA